MSTERKLDRVEDFAALSAQLNEGFDDRGFVLGAAGLDEHSWGHFETRWLTRLAENVDDELARCFTAAYAAERRRIARSMTPNMLPAPDPRFLNADAQSWRAEAAAVPLEASGVAPPLISFGDEETEDANPSARQVLSGPSGLDQTAELVFGRSSPVLPFAAARVVEESGIRPAALARWTGDTRRDVLHAIDSTVEISLNAVCAPVLPFLPAMRPVRRLHRFDSRTGQPLATPYWVDDDAVDPNKSA